MTETFKQISYKPFIPDNWKNVDKSTERILREGTVLDHIHNFGLQCFPDLGGTLATDIALTLGSRILPKIERPDFGGAKIRSRINLMFHWFLGYYKTEFLRHFMETLVPHASNRMPTNAGEWMWVDATKITEPKLRGSLSGNKITPPLSHYADIITIGELMGFIGYGDMGKSMVQWFNTALEERHGTVSMITDVKLKPEIIKKLEEEGIFLDLKTEILTYGIPGVFISCCADLRSGVKANIFDSGFISRWQIRPWNPDEYNFKQIDSKFYQKPKEKGIYNVNAIRNIFSIIKQTTIKKIPQPPYAWQEEILKFRQERIEELVTKFGNLSYTDISTLRDWGDFIRPMAAHALFNQWKRYDCKELTLEFPELKWDVEDKEFILNYMDEIYIPNKMLQYNLQFDDPKSKPDVQTAIYKIIKDNGPISSTDVVKKAKRLGIKGERIVYRHITNLINAKKICVVEIGVAGLRVLVVMK